MALMGLDIGTTRCKAAVFDLDGVTLGIALRPTPVKRDPAGHAFHPVTDLWEAISDAIQEAVTSAGGESIQAIGVGSMAEAGLLVDPCSGESRTDFLPWFDTRATEEAEELEREEGAFALFKATGLHVSYKFGLPKILWVRRQDPMLLRGTAWLSVADYIVYRLTGKMATAPSLAARTLAFNLCRGSWDIARLQRVGLSAGLFPSILPAGVAAGSVSPSGSAATGLGEGTPVAVAGHDHICALIGTGILAPGPALDSMGTAESLLGVLDTLSLGEREFASGLAFVPHTVPERWCWLGGLSSAGGSIEWLRSRLGTPAVTYEEAAQLLTETTLDPSRVLYFPYLAGSGAPHPDQHVRAAFVGLSNEHGRAELFKSVLEGTAFEAESIWRTAEAVSGQTIDDIVVAGGGSRFPRWLQIKSDVSGRPHTSVSRSEEASLLGAALTAGVGTGCIENWPASARIARRRTEDGEVFMSDSSRHSAYQDLYETAYLPMQAPLREVSHRLRVAP